MGVDQITSRNTWCKSGKKSAKDWLAQHQARLQEKGKGIFNEAQLTQLRKAAGVDKAPKKTRTRKTKRAAKPKAPKVDAQKIATIQARIAELEAALGQNS